MDDLIHNWKSNATNLTKNLPCIPLHQDLPEKKVYFVSFFSFLLVLVGYHCHLPFFQKGKNKVTLFLISFSLLLTQWIESLKTRPIIVILIIIFTILLFSPAKFF